MRNGLARLVTMVAALLRVLAFAANPPAANPKASRSTSLLSGMQGTTPAGAAVRGTPE